MLYNISKFSQGEKIIGPVMDRTTFTSDVTSPHKTNVHQKSIQKPEGDNTRASVEMNY